MSGRKKQRLEAQLRDTSRTADQGFNQRMKLTNAI